MTIDSALERKIREGEQLDNEKARLEQEMGNPSSLKEIDEKISRNIKEIMIIEHIKDISVSSESDDYATNLERYKETVTDELEEATSLDEMRDAAHMVSAVSTLYNERHVLLEQVRQDEQQALQEQQHNQQPKQEEIQEKELEQGVEQQRQQQRELQRQQEEERIQSQQHKHEDVEMPSFLDDID